MRSTILRGEMIAVTAFVILRSRRNSADPEVLAERVAKADLVSEADVNMLVASSNV